MKKEVFLAVAIGFGLGLVITFGIWTANKSLKDAQITQPTPTASPAPTVAPQGEVGPTPVPQPTTQNLPLSISSPDDESLVSKNTISVSGKTAADARVVIVSELGEQIVSADSSGSFSADVELEGGYNNLTITAFDASGNSNSQTITVTYTTAKV